MIKQYRDEDNKENEFMSETINPRSAALNALYMILEQDRPSHLVIREILAMHPEYSRQERAFFTRLCEGTVEQMIRLDYVLAKCSSVPVGKMKPLIRTLMRMSVYQIMFMDSVPDSAVCNEAVRLANKRGFSGLKGFVNGVLRSVCRLDKEKTLPDRRKNEREYFSVRYSMPLWLVDYLSEQFGEEQLETILNGFLTERPMTVRMNLSRSGREDILSLLKSSEVGVGEPFGESFSAFNEYFPEAISLTGTGNLKDVPAWRQGLIQVQDIASMLPVYAAQLKPGDHVLDICAAPGGKSLHAADVLAGTGKVISRDLTEDKIKLIRENIVRSKFTGISAEVHDASVFDPSLEGAMDVVIADLPCSGLGIIGKKPDIKYRMSHDQILELAELQKKLLAVAQRYVKPGGKLIFSTCTLSREENQANREFFLSQFPDFSPIELSDKHFLPFEEASLRKGYIQLVPGIHPCDGFYVVAFCRKD